MHTFSVAQQFRWCAFVECVMEIALIALGAFILVAGLARFFWKRGRRSLAREQMERAPAVAAGIADIVRDEVGKAVAGIRDQFPEALEAARLDAHSEMEWELWETAVRKAQEDIRAGSHGIVRISFTRGADFVWAKDEGKFERERENLPQERAFFGAGFVENSLDPERVTSFTLKRGIVLYNPEHKPQGT